MESQSLKSQRPLFQNLSWRFFAVTDGLFKVAQFWLLLLIGVTAAFGPVLFVATAVIGLMQIVSGIVINRRSRYEVFPGRRYVVGSLLVGVLVLYSLVVTVLVFTDPTAEFSFVMFAVALPLILETAIDKRKLRGGSHVVLSIALLAFAVFAFLGFPAALPPAWVITALTLPIAILLNGYVVQKLRVNVISPWVRNVWMGVAIFGLSVAALVLFHPIDQLSHIMQRITDFHWILSILLGTVVLSSTFLHQRTYMYGGSVAVKKCVMTGTFLLVGLALGIVLFAGSVTFGKMLGMIAYIASYLVVEPTVLRSVYREKKEEHKQRIV